MFDMLDVAIGVIFLYLIMSLIASAVAEMIESLLHYRARDLERGIRELVRDPKMVQEIYDHPLVNGLFKGQYDPNHKGRLPSYIPSSTFVLAMLDAVDSVTIESIPAKKVDISPGAMKHWFAEAWLAFFQDEPPAEASAEAVANLKKAIDTLKAAAGNEAAAQRKAIEDWFDASMDRVSGWYKHRTSRNLFLIGLVAAFLLNVDSIKVTKQLMVDKPVRDAIVASATAYGKSAPTYKDAQEQLNDAEKRLKGLGLPIGYSRPVNMWCSVPPDFALIKLLGILITASAVSLGAPFWFDTLNKFIVVRSTVKPEEKSGKEGSKDPKGGK
jgi:hypothetical protein